MQVNVEPTIFVVNENDAIQRALVDLGRSLGFPVECYESGTSFLESMDAARAGCLVLDAVLTDMDGVDLQQRIAEAHLRLPVVFFVSTADVRDVVRAMKQGAVDFLESHHGLRQLKESIRCAMERDTRHRERQAHMDESRRRLAQLTDEERAVLERLVAGKTHTVIARELGVCLRTVQLRRTRMMKRLNLKSRAALFKLLTEMPPAREKHLEVSQAV